MRTLIALLFLVVVAPPLLGQSRPARETNPPTPCGNASTGIPDYYYETVLAQFTPPGFRSSLITITEGAEKKLVLMTDGTKFELWSGTPQTPQNSVNEFLIDLDRSCRLPADPRDAAKLIRVKWRSHKLSPAEFGRLHRTFISALSQFASKAEARYPELLEEKMSSMHLDTLRYPIAYDNGYERLEIWVWNGPETDSEKAMVDWVHGLQRLANDSFHGPLR